MKLSTKSQYACLALIDLAEHVDGGYVKGDGIAARKNIPRRFLEQILLILKRSRHVKSKKGPDGGYMLARPPAEISLAEIIRLIDGALAPVGSASVHFYEPTPSERSDSLMKVLRGIRNHVSRTLENTTFADLARRR